MLVSLQDQNLSYHLSCCVHTSMIDVFGHIFSDVPSIIRSSNIIHPPPGNPIGADQAPVVSRRPARYTMALFFWSSLCCISATANGILPSHSLDTQTAEGSGQGNGLRNPCIQSPLGNTFLSNQPVGSRWSGPHIWRAFSQKFPDNLSMEQSAPAAPLACGQCLFADW